MYRHAVCQRCQFFCCFSEAHHPIVLSWTIIFNLEYVLVWDVKDEQFKDVSETRCKWFSTKLCFMCWLPFLHLWRNCNIICDLLAFSSSTPASWHSSSVFVVDGHLIYQTNLVIIIISVIHRAIHFIMHKKVKRDLLFSSLVLKFSSISENDTTD